DVRDGARRRGRGKLRGLRRRDRRRLSRWGPPDARGDGAAAARMRDTGIGAGGGFGGGGPCPPTRHLSLELERGEVPAIDRLLDGRREVHAIRHEERER